MVSAEELNKLKGSLSQWVKFKDKFEGEIKSDPKNEGVMNRLLKSKQKIQEITNQINAAQNSETPSTDSNSSTEDKEHWARRAGRFVGKHTKNAKNVMTKNRSLSDTSKATGRGIKSAGKSAWKGTKAVGRGGKKLNDFLKREGGASRVNFLFILALIIHGVDGFMNFNSVSFRITAYLFLFFFGWLVVFRERNCSWRDTGIAAGISGALALGAFFVPILMVKFLDPIMSWTLVNVLRICFPVYYLYFLFNPLTPLLKTIQTWVFWFWIFVFIFYLIAAVRFGTLNDVPFLNALDADVFENQDDADAGGAWLSLWNFIKGVALDLFSAVEGMFIQKANETGDFGKSRLEYATGGYYSGNEENAPAQGVFIKNIEYSQPDYIEGDIIEIAARIDIQTPSNSLEFSVDCKAEEEMDEEIIIDGDILELPDGRTMIGYKDELLPITCSFKNGLSSGIYDVVFSVLYDYETSSSLKIYFMDMERKNAMRAEGIDPLEEYGKEKNPKAIYTNGPIKLGIKQPALPIGLDFDNELGPLIGFTIENDWGGEISKINSIYVYTPEGLSLDLNYCDEFTEISTENGMNVYRIANPSKIKKIEDYLTINCKTIIDSKSSLLGDDEISTKEIKVIASYVFETEKSTDIRIG